MTILAQQFDEDKTVYYSKLDWKNKDSIYGKLISVKEYGIEVKELKTKMIPEVLRDASTITKKVQKLEGLERLPAFGYSAPKIGIVMMSVSKN